MIGYRTEEDAVWVVDGEEFVINEYRIFGCDMKVNDGELIMVIDMGRGYLDVGTRFVCVEHNLCRLVGNSLNDILTGTPDPDAPYFSSFVKGLWASLVSAAYLPQGVFVE